MSALRRVLVTGASGFIGRHLVRVLRARGVEVTCLVRRSSDRSALEAAGATFAEGDITDAGSLRAAVPGHDAVFHLASLLKMPWKQAFFDVNTGGTRHVASACATDSPPVLVVVSSLAAAGPSPRESGRVESDGAAPVSVYGRVKRAAELASLEFADRVPVSIVRPPMVFGEGDTSALKLYRSVARGLHAVPTLREHALSMIHATDLAHGLVQVAERGERVPAGRDGSDGTGVYYLAASERPTYAELGSRIARALDLPPPRVVRLPSFVPTVVAGASELVARLRDVPTVLNLDKMREARAGSWTCDASKAANSLGFACAEGLDARLRQTGAWYRAEGLVAQRA